MNKATARARKFLYRHLRTEIPESSFGRGIWYGRVLERAEAAGVGEIDGPLAGAFDGLRDALTLLDNGTAARTAARALAILIDQGTPAGHELQED